MDLVQINNLTGAEFVDVFKNVVEKYDKCASFLSRRRPFSDVHNIIKLSREFLDGLNISDIEEILCFHPDLAGRIADDSNLTSESQLEQRSAGLRDISDDRTKELKNLNIQYKEKFGFPFIICARDNKFNEILFGLKSRLQNTKNQEIQTALEEVKKIVAYRIINLVH